MMRIRRRTGLLALGIVLTMAAGLASAAAAPPFEPWLEELRRDARDAGISAETLERAFEGVEPLPEVVELDRRQPEGRLSFVEYRDRVVSDARIEKGRRLLAKHRDRLAGIEGRYGVPAEIIVALWGIESSFGAFKGRFPVIASLATLAHDGRRADFFRKELLSALRIVEAGDIAPEDMDGSWAGAMGQAQFMPSTYLDYAVDADGDGRRDIWTDLDDVFASMANYLSAVGWDRRYIWGREVEAEPAAAGGLDHEVDLAVWQERGVRRKGGADLPRVALDASLLAMDDGDGPTFLVYDNFRALMRWNRSTYFALAVGLLADTIKRGG